MVKKKMVLKVEMKSHKYQSKAFHISAQAHGVDSVRFEGEDSKGVKTHLVVIGDEVDVVGLATRLRRKVGPTDIVSLVDIPNDS